MRFLVIPALDVAGGRLARFTPSGPEPMKSTFGDDPRAVAREFAAAGARWLHVVDLDLAFTGVSANVGVVRAIADLGVRVQSSGGVVGRAAVEEFLDAGASRVVLGSAAMEDPEALAAIVAEHGDRIALGIETEGGRISPRGRAEGPDISLEEAIRRASAAGVSRLVVTAVARVGTLAGPDLDVLERVATSAERPVLASGGISAASDLEHLRTLPGIEGAIVGRALLDGGLDVRTALSSAR